MNPFKKLWAWLAGPKSDFILFIILLVLANLVASEAFFRVDLTANGVYSLSPASERVLKGVEEPVSVKAFFTSNLPAPYNGVERYLKDLLIEYRGAAGSRFSFDFHDMEDPANEDIARGYGLAPLQIQEVKNNEVGVKTAWMGLAIVYSDAIEVIDSITTTNALEYKLTTTIGKMISTTNALAGLSGTVSLSLYLSPELKDFRITGLDQLEGSARAAVRALNPRYNDKIEFRFVQPAGSTDVDAMSQRYGLQKVSWPASANGGAGGSGLVGLVLEYGDRFRTIPVELQRGFFGGYGLVGLETLESTIADSLQALVSRSLSIGYLMSNGEKDINDDQQGAGRLAMLASDYYNFVELNLNEQEVPAEITSLVINGPRSYYSDIELYRIDQFLMRGGKLLVMADSFTEIRSQEMSWMGSAPTYQPIDHRLDTILGKYGISIAENYVFDEKCYNVRQQGMGEFPLYYVPIITRDRLDKDHPITRNMDQVLMLKASEVRLADTLPEGLSATVLAKTTPTAWTIADTSRINLTPMGMSRPSDESEMAERNLIVLVEGRFPSAFDREVLPEDQSTADNIVADSGNSLQPANMAASKHLTQAVQDAAIIVIGSSELGGSSLIDERGSQPVAILMRNILDWLNGNGELNEMRVKSLDLNILADHEPAVKTLVKSLNIYFVPLLAVFAGLLAWRLRSVRRRRIERAYALASSTSAESTEA